MLQFLGTDVARADASDDATREDTGAILGMYHGHAGERFRERFGEQVTPYENFWGAPKLPHSRVTSKIMPIQ